jgi:hypothetical protein
MTLPCSSHERVRAPMASGRYAGGGGRERDMVREVRKGVIVRRGTVRRGRRGGRRSWQRWPGSRWRC